MCLRKSVFVFKEVLVLTGEGPGCVGPYWSGTGMHGSLLERGQDVWVPSGEGPRCMSP